MFAVTPEAIEFIGDNRQRYFRRLLIVLPLTAWSSFFFQISPLFIKTQVDILTQNLTSFYGIEFNSSWNFFIAVTVAYLTLVLLDRILVYFRDDVLQRINRQTESHLEDKFTKYLTRFDGSFLTSENNLRLIRNLQWRFGQIETKINTLLQKSIEIVIGAVAVIGILPLIHPYLLVLILCTVAVSMLLDVGQNNSWKRYEIIESRQYEMRHELRWRLILFFNRILANGWVTEVYRNYQNRRDSWFNTKYSQQNIDRRFTLAKDSVNGVSQAGSSLVAASLVLARQIDLGTFVIFGFYVDRVKSVLTNVGDIFRLVAELRFDLFRIDFLIHIQPKLDYRQISSEAVENIESIRFEQVSFTYPKFFEEEQAYLEQMQIRVGLKSGPQLDLSGSDSVIDRRQLMYRNWRRLQSKIAPKHVHPWVRRQLQDEFKELESMFQQAQENKVVLNDLSFELKAGKVYGIVGYNGAGKTTLTKLIKRTVDPSEGKIFINDRSLITVDPLAWKDSIASIEQQSFVWETLSVRDNLLLGMKRPAESVFDEELWQALAKVGLEKDVTNLDAIFGEGLEMSGGQKQLLEIARVYLQKKPLVILDEGTNQLDAVKESGILAVLHEIKKHSVVIFITHRMTTCSRCDEILVLDNGQLAAQGTHDQLLNSEKYNLYQKFWSIQVDGNAA
ncbi:MAG: hypothetical protein OHK0017_11340 [Patescibacteria group bacterium]